MGEEPDRVVENWAARLEAKPSPATITQRPSDRRQDPARLLSGLGVIMSKTVRPLEEARFEAARHGSLPLVISFYTNLEQMP